MTDPATQVRKSANTRSGGLSGRQVTIPNLEQLSRIANRTNLQDHSHVSRDVGDSGYASMRAMLDNESITIHVTKIEGQSYPDDYTVIWRGLPIGRIRKSPGLPAHADQWSWGCNVYGRPSRTRDSGQGSDLEDCMAKLKAAWARIGAGLTDWDIAKARQYAKTSAEALTR